MYQPLVPAPDRDGNRIYVARRNCVDIPQNNPDPAESQVALAAHNTIVQGHSPTRAMAIMDFRQRPLVRNVDQVDRVEGGTATAVTFGGLVDGTYRIRVGGVDMFPGKEEIEVELITVDDARRHNWHNRDASADAPFAVVALKHNNLYLSATDTPVTFRAGAARFHEQFRIRVATAAEVAAAEVAADAAEAAAEDLSAPGASLHRSQGYAPPYTMDLKQWMQ